MTALRSVRVPAVVAAALAVGGVLVLLLAYPLSSDRWQRWVYRLDVVASVVLTLYGAVLVVAGALVLSDVIHPNASTDLHALRWHVGLWDAWFLAWGLATGWTVVAYRRGQRTRSPTTH